MPLCLYLHAPAFLRRDKSSASTCLNENGIFPLMGCLSRRKTTISKAPANLVLFNLYASLKSLFILFLELALGTLFLGTERPIRLAFELFSIRQTPRNLPRRKLPSRHTRPYSNGFARRSPLLSPSLLSPIKPKALFSLFFFCFLKPFVRSSRSFSFGIRGPSFF